MYSYTHVSMHVRENARPWGGHGGASSILKGTEMQRRIRSATLVALVVAASMTMTTACTNQSTGDDPTIEQIDRVINMLVPQATFQQSLEPLLESFTAETGLQINTTVMPNSDVESRQVLDLANKSGIYDLIVLDDRPWLSEMYKGMLPLNDLIKRDNVDLSSFFEPGLDLFAAEGNQYGFPFGLGPWILVYRADLFEQKGLEPPVTFADMLSVAEALTEGGTYGLSIPLGSATHLVTIWLTLAYNAGLLELLSDDGTKPAFNNEAGLKALELMVKAYQDGYISEDAITAADTAAVRTALQKGKAAMAFLSTSSLNQLNAEGSSDYAGKFFLATPPILNASIDPVYFVTGWGYGISKYSNNQNNAWKLIKYLIDSYQYPGPDAPRTLLQYPNSKAAIELPAVAEIYPEGQAGIIRNALESPVARPFTPKWSAVMNAMASRFQASFTGRMTPQEALDAAEIDVAAILVEF